jgi:hypothetical protein
MSHRIREAMKPHKYPDPLGGAGKIVEAVSIRRSTSSSEIRCELFAMKDDLRDALVPVKWAEAQMPILKDRFLAWQHTDPYKIVAEPDPSRGNWELLVAYPEKPLDPLIVGDVGAMVNSIRTGLDLMMAAVVARHGIVPRRAPNFPIHKTSADFLAAVDDLENKKWISSLEATVIKRTKAYNGGDGMLFHIQTLDNLRKHQRLLTVKPIPSQVDITTRGVGFEQLMTHMQDKTILYRFPSGAFRPTKGNTNITAEIFLNEAPAGVGDHPALLALRVYIARVKELIQSFP